MIVINKVVNSMEVYKSLQEGNSIFIDTRSSDRFNGWPYTEDSRGGNIPTALSLPFKWTRYMDWLDIVLSKQIPFTASLIIYGDNRKEIDTVGSMFIKANFKHVSLYYDFKEEWLSDPAMPVEYLPRFRNLVSAEWVDELIKGQNPLFHDNKKYVIVQAHYRNRQAYLSGHIPGAIDMDTLEVESPSTWNRRSPIELRANLEKHGITHDTTVVLYGKYMNPDNNDEFPGSAAGHIGAIRSAFILMYAGVEDVRILDGGFQSWKDSGLPVELDDVPKTPVHDFGIEIPQKPELAVDIEEAKQMLKENDSALVCVRSWPEYIGELSGYNYIVKKGRIPGAIFGNCGSDAYHMENYRNPDHTIRPFREVEKIWYEHGITPDKHLAFYCGTGWRGSEAFYNAWLMGWPRISVFDGGWFEWSNDPANPYETGLPST